MLSIERNVEGLKNDEGNQEIPIKCSKCGRSEHEVAVFPVRMKGTSTWVCARCLPGLIHG